MVLQITSRLSTFQISWADLVRYDNEMRELCPFVTVNHESSVAQASYFYFLGSGMQLSV